MYAMSAGEMVDSACTAGGSGVKTFLSDGLGADGMSGMPRIHIAPADVDDAWSENSMTANDVGDGCEAG